MSIATKLNSIVNSLQAVRTAIINKGQSVPSGTDLADWASKIDAIETGGGMEINGQTIVSGVAAEDIDALDVVVRVRKYGFSDGVFNSKPISSLDIPGFSQGLSMSRLIYSNNKKLMFVTLNSINYLFKRNVDGSWQNISSLVPTLQQVSVAQFSEDSNIFVIRRNDTSAINIYNANDNFSTLGQYTVGSSAPFAISYDGTYVVFRSNTGNGIGLLKYNGIAYVSITPPIISHPSTIGGFVFNPDTSHLVVFGTAGSFNPPSMVILTRIGDVFQSGVTVNGVTSTNVSNVAMRRCVFSLDGSYLIVFHSTQSRCIIYSRTGSNTYQEINVLTGFTSPNITFVDDGETAFITSGANPNKLFYYKTTNNQFVEIQGTYGVGSNSVVMSHITDLMCLFDGSSTGIYVLEFTDPALVIFKESSLFNSIYRLDIGYAPQAIAKDATGNMISIARNTALYPEE